jgi:hypothetical protein
MVKFEEAGRDVVTSQNALDAQGTQLAIDALSRAEKQRRRAVNKHAASSRQHGRH